MKRKIAEIYNEYKEEFLHYISNVKSLLNNYFDSSKKKKYLRIIGFLIILNFLFLNIYISYGYYYSDSTFPLVHALVGNKYLNENDFTILVYIEDNNGKYKLVNSIPSTGYSYEGYYCTNNSELSYDESNKITSVTTDKKEVCAIYFKSEENTQLNLNIMLEDAVGSDTYTLGESVPINGYNYKSYECKNDSVVEYSEQLHKVTLKSNNIDICNVYFVMDE